jgi:hypothetical protein
MTVEEIKEYVELALLEISDLKEIDIEIDVDIYPNYVKIRSKYFDIVYCYIHSNYRLNVTDEIYREIVEEVSKKISILTGYKLNGINYDCDGIFTLEVYLLK